MNDIRNVRVETVSHLEADKKSGVIKKYKFPNKSFSLIRGMFYRHI